LKSAILAVSLGSDTAKIQTIQRDIVARTPKYPFGIAATTFGYSDSFDF